MWARLGRRFSVVDRNWPVGRPGGRPRGRGRAGGAGERQGPRAHHAWPARPEDEVRRRALEEPKVEGAPGRQGDREGRGGPGPAGERGGRDESGARWPSSLLPAAGRVRLRPGGTGVDRRPLDQADRRAAVQGHDRQARPRPEDHPEGDRGAAEARPLRRGPGADGRRRAGRGRADRQLRRRCRSASARGDRRRGRTHPGQPLRDHPDGAGPVPKVGRHRADLAERRLLVPRRVRRRATIPRRFFDREEQAIDRLATAFARNLVAAMLEAF